MFDPNQLLELVKGQYLAYGYLIVLIAAYVEYVFPIGYFWPGGTFIMLGVVYSIDGKLSWPLIVGLVWLGASLGNVTNYWLGQAGLLQLLKASRFYPRFAPYLERAQRFMEKRGQRAVFLSQFIGYIRPVVSVLAGTTRLPFGRFMISQVPGVLLWNIIFCGVGYLLAKTVGNIETLMSGLGLIILVIVGLSWLGLRYFTRRRQGRSG